MTPDNSFNTEAAAVADLVTQANRPILNVMPEGLAVFPSGAVVNLAKERFMDNPKRKRASVRLHETASFIGYVNTHKHATETHLFGESSEQGGKFCAIIDYHDVAAAGESIAHWGEHVVTLTLQTTPEWQRWMANSGKAMLQEVFADFLEDNLNDIDEPDAATLIDVAQLLQGKKSVNFKSGKNLRNGAIQLEYVETIDTTGGTIKDNMQVPDHFVLGICPFVGAAGIQVNARLRFRVSDSGKLTFTYLLDRPFKVIADAFELAREEIEEKTALPVHLGSATIPLALND